MKNHLKITIEKTTLSENTLKDLGYEKRSGSGGRGRDTLTFIPDKKWYWFSEDIIAIQTISLQE